MTKEEPKAASRGLRGFERDASKRVHSLQPGQMQRPRDSQKNLYAPTLTNNLLDMPVDTVLEILKYLTPREFLHLTRTNRALRRYLLNPSSATAWKRAFENVERLPPCPDYLSEPAYASLVYDAYCHNCYKIGTKVVLWQYSVRYCKACCKTMFQPFGITLQQLPESISAHNIDDYLCYLPGRRDEQTRQLYHKPDVQSISLLYDQGGMNALENVKRNVLKHREQACRCIAWMKTEKSLYQQKLEAARQRRQGEIRYRLCAAGWGGELDWLDSQPPTYERGWREKRTEFASHVLVDVPEDLTEEEWTRIRQPLETFMHSVALRRCRALLRDLEKNRFNMFDQLYQSWRIKHLPYDPAPPRSVDFIHQHELRNVLLSGEEFILRLESLYDYVPVWVDQWRNYREKELRKLVLSSNDYQGPKDENTDPLDLASTVFACDMCFEKEPLHYPAVLAHRCSWSAFFLFSKESEDNLEAIAQEVCGHCRWSSRLLEINVMHARAVAVIRACGQDPWRATAEDMDLLDIRLYCNVCEASRKPRSGRKIMTWRAAIRHYIGHDREGDITLMRDHQYLATLIEWQQVSSDHLMEVHTIEDSATPFYQAKYDDEADSKWHCTHCCRYDMECGESVAEIKQHIASKHGITDIGTQDYFRDLSMGPFMVSPIMLISDRLASEKGEELEPETRQWLEEGRAGFCRI